MISLSHASDLLADSLYSLILYLLWQTFSTLPWYRQVEQRTFNVKLGYMHVLSYLNLSCKCDSIMPQDRFAVSCHNTETNYSEGYLWEQLCCNVNTQILTNHTCKLFSGIIHSLKSRVFYGMICPEHNLHEHSRRLNFLWKSAPTELADHWGRLCFTIVHLRMTIKILTELVLKRHS